MKSVIPNVLPSPADSGSYSGAHMRSRIKWLVWSVALILVGMSYGVESRSTATMMVMVGLFGLSLISAWQAQFDLAHPAVWFGIPFTLYAVITPIFYLLDIYHYYENYGPDFDIHFVLVVEFIALASFLVAIPGQPRWLADSFWNDRWGTLSPHIVRGSFPLLLGASFLALIHLSMLWISGFQSKIDIIASDQPWLRISFAFHLMAVGAAAYILGCRRLSPRFPWRSMVAFAVFLALSVMVAGERGVLFRYLLVVVVMWHLCYRKLKIHHLVFGFAIALYAAEILGYFKVYFLSRDFVGIEFGDSIEDVFVMMFGGEMRTASENLAVVTSHIPNSIPYQGLDPVFMDLRRVVLPGFLLPRGLYPSTVDWFNMTFFTKLYDSGGGVGFTLVGFAYLCYGIPFVILFFVSLGLGVRLLYTRASTSSVYVLCYANAIPLLIYSIRSDLATILSQGAKHILLPIGLMWVIGRLRGRKLLNVDERGTSGRLSDSVDCPEGSLPCEPSIPGPKSESRDLEPLG
jgi:hypothetical protein